jgi:hypothetical protein
MLLKLTGIMYNEHVATLFRANIIISLKTCRASNLCLPLVLILSIQHGAQARVGFVEHTSEEAPYDRGTLWRSSEVSLFIAEW